METNRNNSRIDNGNKENNHGRHHVVFIPAKNKNATFGMMETETSPEKKAGAGQENQMANLSAAEEINSQNIPVNHFAPDDSDTVKYERTQMCFLYIGSNESVVKHFRNNFEFGYKETNLSEAGFYLHQLYHHNKRLPDVVFIDVPLDEKELHDFCSGIKSNLLLGNLPVIYNEQQLTGKQMKQLNHLPLIDDIISVNSNEINYFSKIMFLKQCKLYNQIYTSGKNHSAKNIAGFKKTSAPSLSFILKRAIDISIASLGILLISPILLLIAIAIKLESRGPVFYTAARAGKGFKVFKFYKFRSMVCDADKDVESLSDFNQYNTSNNGPLFFKINNDPRITKIGKFLRNTSADELPQLLNVIKGDMSLVGNRPLPIYEAVTLTTNEFVERFSAPAGITGLWQVNKRGKADMSIEERINLDITYSRKCNFLYDLSILVKTPLALFQKSDV